MKPLNRASILQALEREGEAIRSFGVTSLALFGSYARDEQKPGSDIDFLVEFAPGRGAYRDYMDLLFFLQDLFHTEDIDLAKPHLVRQELRTRILGGVLHAANL